MTTQIHVEPDLSGWLGGHRIMRIEFGRLAAAAREVSPSDVQRTEALDAHLAFMIRRLTWHHWQEDNSIFPGLCERDGSLATLLGELEAEHEHLDLLIAAAAEHSVPFGERQQVLRLLHGCLEAHLDHEEREAVPAIRRLIPADVWALGHEEFLAALGADRDLTMVWMLSHLPPEGRAGMLASLPDADRARFETTLLPEQQRRIALLYGPDAR
jgi:hypothetical protein